MVTQRQLLLTSSLPLFDWLIRLRVNFDGHLLFAYGFDRIALQDCNLHTCLLLTQPLRKRCTVGGVSACFFAFSHSHLSPETDNASHFDLCQLDLDPGHTMTRDMNGSLQEQEGQCSFFAGPAFECLVLAMVSI